MGDLRLLAAGLGVALLVSLGVSGVPSEPRQIQVTARRFEFQPNRIELKLGEPVQITFASLDAPYAFACKGLNLEKVVFEKDKPTTIVFTPEKQGAFEFQCAGACGQDPAGIKRQIVVTP